MVEPHERDVVQLARLQKLSLQRLRAGRIHGLASLTSRNITGRSSVGRMHGLGP